MSNICLFAAKILSMVYYALVFNYPWKSNEAYNEKYPTLYQLKTTSTNKRIIGFLFIYNIACLAHNIGAMWDYNIFNVISVVCAIYGLFIPIGISQCCSTVILLEYELFLQTLTQTLISGKNETTYHFITKEYKLKIFSFRKECKFWRWYFGLKVFVFFTYIWLYTSMMIHRDLDVSTKIFVYAGFVVWLSPFIELVIASSHLSVAFGEFQEQLLVVQANHIYENAEDTKRILECNHLYNYICANRMVFRLFGSELNLINAIKLSIFFVLAKMISYSIYNI